MLTSIRGLMAATLLAGCGLTSVPALAQEAPGDFEISGNAAVVSEYRFRGVDLSGGDVAIQGGIDVAHSSGIYVGTWGSSLDEDTVGFGSTEIDIYGGWSGDIASGLNADVGVMYYAYPNAPDGDYDYVELYGKLGITLGPVESKVGVAYAPDQNSLGDTDNLYLFADVSSGVPGTPVSVNAHVGYTDGFLTYTDNSKAWDWSVGADLAISEKLSVGVSYVDAEGDFLPGDYRFTKSAVVGKLSVSF